MNDRDLTCWRLGLVLMFVGSFEPWPMANPDVIFALGLGLSISPTTRALAEMMGWADGTNKN